MIELILAVRLYNLVKTEVIGIGDLENEHDVNEILSQLGNVGNPFILCCNSNHGLGRLDLYPSYLSIFLNKIVEQVFCVL